MHLIFINSSGSVVRLVTELATEQSTVTWLTYAFEPYAFTISLVFQGNPETQLTASFFSVCLRIEVSPTVLRDWTLEQKVIHQTRDTVP